VTRRCSSFAGSALAAIVLVATVSNPAAAEGSTARPPVEASVPRPSSPWLTRTQTGGLVLFGVSYGAALGVPVVGGFSDGREWFAVPFAGPILAVAYDRPGARSEALHLDPWAIVLDEIGQVGGVALFLAGDSVSWGSSASVARCRGGGLCVGARGFF
jgi:hypothetical protein